MEKFYFDVHAPAFGYLADTTKGVVAHYYFDNREVGGTIFLTFRRVIPCDPETDTPRISVLSTFLLDYIDISI